MRTRGMFVVTVTLVRSERVSRPLDRELSPQ